MKARKPFVAPPPVVVATAPQPVSPQDGGNPLVINVPENPQRFRTLDLTPWLNQGIDAWIHASAGQLHASLQGKSVATATVVSHWKSGIRYFFEFLVSTKGKADPALLGPQDIRRFLGWLSEQGLSYGAQKAIFAHTKSVLTALVRRQIIPAQDGLFPANPFPDSNSRRKGQAPLSSGERARLAAALRNDLIAINKGRFGGTGSQALVVHLLAVAIRCGTNPTPLLEATRDCLQDHPFMPTMKRLILFKRRGNATKIVQLRYHQSNDDSVSVAMDGVALVMKARAYSEPLLPEAKPEHRNRLWLYRSESIRNTDKISPLRYGGLDSGITALITRHDLRGDDGEPLRHHKELLVDAEAWGPGAVKRVKEDLAQAARILTDLGIDPERGTGDAQSGAR